jgi:hypothetical protein
MADEGLSIPYESLTEEALTKYVDSVVAYRERVASLWKKAQRNLVGMTCAKGQLQRLGLLTQLDSDRRESGPARLYGTTWMKQVDKCFQPNAGHSDWGSNARRSGTRIFRGRGWNEMLLLPYFQGPGRLSNLLFVGRDCKRKNGDFVRKRIGQIGAKSHDPGLAGLMGLSKHHHRVIAMDDPLVMLRIQMRHFTTNLNPLPLVSWLPDTNCWDALNDRHLVFWTMQPTVELMLQLLKTDAYLAVMGPQDKSRRSVNGWLRKRQSADLEQAIYDRAKPWRETLKTWMQRAPEQAVVRLLSQVAKASDDLAEELSDLGVKRTAFQRLQVRQAVVGEKSYVERNGTLYHKGKKEIKLLPGHLRVEKIIDRGDSITYIGYLRHVSRKVEFEWAEGKSFKTHLTHQCIREGIHLKIPGNHDLLGVAMAFSNPEILKGKQEIGWEDDRVWFKNFSVRPGKGPIVNHDPRIFPPDMPGPSTLPRGTDGHIERLAATGPAASFFWAITTSILEQILAPSVGLSPSPVVICGETTVTPAQAILGRLSVPERYLYRERRDQARATCAPWPHKYPFLVKLDSHVKLGKMHRWMLERQVPYVVSTTSRANAYALALHGGFNLIHTEEPLTAAAIAQMPMELVIPWFLRDVWVKEPTWTSIQKALLKWVKGLGLAGSAVKASEKLWAGEDEDLWEKAMAAFWKEGILRDRATIKQSVAAPWDSRGLVLDHQTINAAFRCVGFVTPDLTDVPEPLIVSRRYL